MKNTYHSDIYKFNTPTNSYGKTKLDIKDAKNIGKAINLIDQNSGPKLGTVSISFNKKFKR